MSPEAAGRVRRDPRPLPGGACSAPAQNLAEAMLYKGPPVTFWPGQQRHPS